MTKKIGIMLLLSTILIFTVGCDTTNQQTTTIKKSKDLKICQKECDKLALVRGPAQKEMKTSCYNNCQNTDTARYQKDDHTIITQENDPAEMTDQEEKVYLNTCKNICSKKRGGEKEIKECNTYCETSIKIKNQDFNDCQNIEKISNGLLTQDMCIAQKALDQNKPEYCGVINDSKEKDNCYKSFE